MPYIIMIVGVLFAMAPSFGERYKEKIDGLIKHLRSHRQFKDS